MQGEAQRMQATLVRLAVGGVTASCVADVAVSMWRDLYAALAPIIGPRGVAALFQRSVCLARWDHLWLSTVNDRTSWDGQLDALHAVLSQQTAELASAANGALLQVLSNLLANLIGRALTERLLASVVDHPPRGAASQDTST